MKRCIIFSRIYYTFYMNLESIFYSNVEGRSNARNVSVNIFAKLIINFKQKNQEQFISISI